MNRLSLAATAAILIACAPHAGAQQTAALPNGTPPGQAAEATYPLAPDDVINIQVINFPELSVPTTTIPPDGRISVPLLGSLKVAGRTTDQLARTLAAQWGEYVVSPSVSVSLSQKRHESVSFYGFAAHPQAVDYHSGLHLVQALAEVGGAAEGGDLGSVTVTHKSGARETVDLSDPQTRGGTAQDLALLPDDVIYIPERHTQVSILGEVVKPGSYDYKPQMTVLDALKDADNISQETADLPDATLLHNGQERKLDLDALLKKGELENNVTLAAGDRIFIPEMNNHVFVDGAVGKAGRYTFKPGDRIADAISSSGGLLQYADLAKVTLIHQDKLHNTATGQTVDIGKFYQKADMSVNVPLLPGDVLYVPIKGHHQNFGDVIGALTGVGALASSARIMGL